MHAIITNGFGGPEVLQWAEVPTPVPAPGEILVRTVAAGVNRADLLQRQGHYPPPAGISDIIGLEATGIVEALGEGVTQHAVGDPVVALIAGGGYAEYFVVPEGQATTPPADVDLISAAGIMEVAGTVLSNMDAVHLSAGETFLVHGGAGGIGSFAIQYAKALGCRVATTAGSPEKLEFCRSIGADIALYYHDEWDDALLVATNDHGADVILDIIGAAYFERNLRAMAMDGRMVIIGMQKGRKGEFSIPSLTAKRGTIMATSIRMRPIEQKVHIVEQVSERVWPMITSGQIQLVPETRIALPEAVRAHQLLESGDSIGKIILTA